MWKRIWAMVGKVLSDPSAHMQMHTYAHVCTHTCMVIAIPGTEWLAKFLFRLDFTVWPWIQRSELSILLESSAKCKRLVLVFLMFESTTCKVGSLTAMFCCDSYSFFGYQSDICHCIVGCAFNKI